jgi:uncharacterized membrane protein
MWRILANNAQLVGGLSVIIAGWLLFKGTTEYSTILCISGIILILLGSYMKKRIKRNAEEQNGVPLEDEFARRIKHRAGFAAFNASLYVWMAIFVLSDDLFDKPRTMLGVGILAQAALYGLCSMYFKKRGVDGGQLN